MGSATASSPSSPPTLALPPVGDISKVTEVAAQGPGAPASSAKPSKLTMLNPVQWIAGIQENSKDKAINEAKQQLSTAITADIGKKCFDPQNLAAVFEAWQSAADVDYKGNADCAQQLIHAVFSQAVQTLQAKQLDQLEPFVEGILAVPACAHIATSFAEKAIRDQIVSEYGLSLNAVPVTRVYANQVDGMSNGEYALHLCNLFRLGDKPSQDQITKARKALATDEYTASSCGHMVVDYLKTFKPTGDDLAERNNHPASLLLQAITGFIFHPAMNGQDQFEVEGHPANFFNLPATITRKYFNSVVANKTTEFIRYAFKKGNPCYEGAVEHLLAFSPFGQTRVIFHPRPQWQENWAEANVSPLVDWAIRSMLEDYRRATNLPLASMTEQTIEGVLSASPNFSRFVVANEDKILARIFDDKQPKLLDYEAEIKEALNTELASMVASAQQNLQSQIGQEGAYVRVVKEGLSMASELQRYKNPNRPSPCTHLLAWGQFYTSRQTPALVFAPSTQVVLGGKINLFSNALARANLIDQFANQEGAINYPGYGNYLAAFLKNKFVLDLNAIPHKIAEQYARASRFSPNPQPLLNANSKRLVQAILQHYGLTTATCTEAQIRNCLQQFIEQFPQYKPQALAAVDKLNKNPAQFLQKVQSNLPTPNPNKYSKQLPHNEMLALPNLDNVIGMAIRALDTSNITLVLKQIADLKTEYAKLSLTWVDFDVYLHVWCNNSPSHLVCFKPEALACWTFENLVQFIQAPAGGPQTMEWDCSAHFKAVYTLSMHRHYSKDKFYTFVNLSVIPNTIKQALNINTSNLIELLLQSLRNRPLPFATIRPFVHMLAASNVSITDAALQLAEQVYPDNLEAKNFLGELKKTPTRTIVDNWILDRLAELPKNHPDFSLNVITLRRANGIAETGRGAYIPEEGLFRLIKGTYTVNEHPGLRFEGTAQYKPSLKTVVTNHQQGQGCLLEKTDKATYRYLYLNNPNPRIRVPAVGVQVQTQSLYASRQLRFFCGQPGQGLKANPVQLVFSYQPNRDNPWQLQVFLAEFHGEYFHAIQMPTPVFECALPENPYLKGVKDLEKFEADLVDLKKGSPNSINWLLPPMPESFPGLQPLNAMAYRLAVLAYVQGLSAKHVVRQGFLETLQNEIKTELVMLPTIQAALPWINEASDFDATRCLVSLLANRSDQPDPPNLLNLIREGRKITQQMKASEDLRVPSESNFGNHSSILFQIKNLISNNTLTADALQDMQLSELVFLLSILPSSLQHSVNHIAQRTPGFFKKLAKEVKAPERLKQYQRSELIAIVNLLNQALPTASRRWSAPRAHHYTKAASFAAFMVMRVLALGAADAFDIFGLGGIMGLDDIADLHESVNAAEYNVLEKQNQQALKLAEFEELYGYQGGPEYDHYMNATKNLLDQAKQDPTLDDFLSRTFSNINYNSESNSMGSKSHSYLSALKEQVKLEDTPSRFDRSLMHDLNDFIPFYSNDDLSAVDKRSIPATEEWQAAADELRKTTLFQHGTWNYKVDYFTADYSRIPQEAMESGAEQFFVAKKAIYVDAPAKETMRAQQALEAAQSKLHGTLQAQSNIQAGLVGVEAEAGLMVTSGALLSENPLEKTWLGKALDIKKEWIAPVSVLGLVLNSPDIAKALRSQQTKLAYLQELVLDEIYRKSNSSLHQEENQGLLKRTITNFEENKIPGYVQGSVLKKGTEALVKPSSTASNIILDDFVQKNIKSRKYYAAHKAGANLREMPWAHKCIATMKAAWSLIKYGMNRLVRHTRVLPHVVSMLCASFIYKRLTVNRLERSMVSHLDTRAQHLKTKGVTVLGALFKAQNQPQLQETELAVIAP